MKKICSNKKYHYYIAYVYTTKNNVTGYGNMYISNDNKLSIQTKSDINNIEKFIKYKLNHIQIKSIVIMDWRELKGE